MTGVSHYPPGTNAFQNVPPRGTDKPVKQPRTRKAKPKALQAAISLETPEERNARKEAKATEFKNVAGWVPPNFGAKPDKQALRDKSVRISDRGYPLAIDR